MARTPLSPRRRARRQNAASFSLPAPTAGWVTAKNVSEMQPNEALVLDNAFPSQEDVSSRKGYTQHATGMVGNVETLISYSNAAGDQLLASANGDIYNVTGAGAVGAALETGLVSSRIQYVNFGTSAGQFAVMVNGQDTPRSYNGTTVSTLAITGTGLDPADFISVNEFKERLFFIEKNSLSFWYLPVQSIAGEALEFPLGALCSKGGHLVAMGTWTRDGGSGMDDMAAFITSNGQVLVYQGTNPSNPNFWALAGVYNVAPPIGQRCFVNIGTELYILTTNGFLPLSVVITQGLVSASANSISSNISNTVNLAASAAKGIFGWEGIQYSKGNYNLFNIPLTSTGIFHQYVVNAQTGAWCRFTGMNANTFGLLDENLYFGGTDGKVYLADNGTSDDGEAISMNLKAAFSFLGNRTQSKKITQVRPVMATDGTIDIGIGVDVDFEEGQTPKLIAFNATSSSQGAAWDETPWDEEFWSPDEIIVQNWFGSVAVGRAFSFRLRYESDSSALRLKSTDWQWTLGGID